MFAGLFALPVLGKVFLFFTSTAGMVVVGILAFVIWLGIHDSRLTSQIRAECDAAQLRVTIDELQRESRVYADALRKAGAQAALDEAENDRLERYKDDLLGKIENSDNACVIDDATLQRMRGIK